jgi:hypothetical protein
MLLRPTRPGMYSPPSSARAQLTLLSSLDTSSAGWVAGGGWGGRHAPILWNQHASDCRSTVHLSNQG